MQVSRLILLTFLISSSFLVRAQSNNPVGGHFGLKVGGSLTRLRLSGTSANIPKQNLDPHIGVMYRYRYHRLVLQPEALLNIKGGAFQAVQADGTRQTINNTYTYVSVPLLFGYIPTEGLTIQAGPEFSYALNSGSANGPGRNNDLGVVLGAHYDFLDMLDKFSLHVRYIYGVTNVSPEATATYQNRVFQASLVYNLYPKKKKK
ncbi:MULTISPECIES: porin family protein [Spirosoma]|uniref:PorT family protein n=1 Tax=Spirosoma liriopis TaxID=2937440 RepID=A0ABT0HGQ0_9BACT|nr:MULTISPECIES: porin family protein [Spirosoma]MCK8491338.1 PorT family protein [Spirosoma liriopis]UHG90709.1 PorT family protein [Spirosoma oryzicola]